eukprot:1150595-Pelagomonas_calceolata.AAC.1
MSRRKGVLPDTSAEVLVTPQIQQSHTKFSIHSLCKLDTPRHVKSWPLLKKHTPHRKPRLKTFVVQKPGSSLRNRITEHAQTG